MGDISTAVRAALPGRSRTIIVKPQDQPPVTPPSEQPCETPTEPAPAPAPEPDREAVPA